MSQMDEMLPISLEDATTLFLRSLGVMVINAWANWFSAIIALPTIISFYLIRQYYIRTAREVKRLDGVLRYKFERGTKTFEFKKSTDFSIFILQN